MQLVSPDFGTHNFTAYDGNGNLLQQTDAQGKLISYTYDKLDRPTTITYSGDSPSNTTFSYDSGTYVIGQLSKLVNGLVILANKGKNAQAIMSMNIPDPSVQFSYSHGTWIISATK